jgi:hypothetical protein
MVGHPRVGPHQQAVTGERLGIGVVRRRGQLLSPERNLGVRPAVVVGLGQPTPPDCVANAQGPRRVGQRSLDQPVAPCLFRR